MALPTKPEKPKKPQKTEVITDWEKIFCARYLVHFDAGLAYREARSDIPLKRTSSIVSGSNWLKRPYIKDYLAKLTAEKLEKVNAPLERVLEEIRNVAFFSPEAFTDMTGEEPRLDLSKLMSDPNALRACLVEFHKDVDKDGGEHQVYKLKQQDKLAALFKLLDYHRVAGAGSNEENQRQININVSFLLPGSRWANPEQADDLDVEGPLEG